MYIPGSIKSEGNCVSQDKKNCHLNVILICNIYMYISLKLILPPDSSRCRASPSMEEFDFYNITKHQSIKCIRQAL